MKPSRSAVRLSFIGLGIVLLAGCGSMNFGIGNPFRSLASPTSLVPGKSTAKDAEALLGAPTEKLQAGADSLWFYSRLPAGRQIYAVRIGADAVVKSVEERLTPPFIGRVRTGMSAAQVREILGPPFSSVRFALKQRDVWEYQTQGSDPMLLWIAFSYDGRVAEIEHSRDLNPEQVKSADD